MPVLINSSTGMAEDLPTEQAQPALDAGSHQVPLNDPEGNPATANQSDVQNLLDEGYTQPSSDQLQSLLDYAKYNQPGEEAKTVAEGALSGATLGVGTGAESAIAGNEAEQQKRRLYNPKLFGIGQGLGVAATVPLGGYGEAGILRGAGEAGAEALGLGAAEGTLSKIGAAAVKGAVESGAFDATDELSKRFSGDPDQTIGSAMTSIGLSSLLGGAGGGAFQAANPLWESTVGKKLGTWMEGAKSLVLGETKPLPQEIAAQVALSGVDIPPEVKAALRDDPFLKDVFASVRDSKDVQAGVDLEKTLGQYYGDQQKSVLQSFGHTPESLEGMGEISQAGTGDNLKQALVKNAQDMSEHFKDYQQATESVGPTKLTDEFRNGLASNILSQAKSAGLLVSPGSPEAGLISRVIKELGPDNLQTVNDLRDYQSSIRRQIQGNPELSLAGKIVNGALRSGEWDAAQAALGQTQGSAYVDQITALNSAYQTSMGTLEKLGDHLPGIGRWRGPNGFAQAVNEMEPEKIIQGLSTEKSTELTDLLRQEVPDAADIVRKYKQDKILQSAFLARKNEQIFNPLTLNNEIKKLTKTSPEFRDWVIPTPIQQKIEAINGLNGIISNIKQNTSNTGYTLGKIFGGFPRMIGAGMGLAEGGAKGLLKGFGLGEAVKFLSRDVPATLQLQLLKRLGQDQPINPSAFQNASKMMVNYFKGENLIKAGVKSLFQGASIVLPSKLIPSEEDKEKVSNRVDDYLANSGKLFGIDGEIGYYLPDHGRSLAETATKAVQYLSSLKPVTSPQGVFDDERIPTDIEQDRYDSALAMAEQPLLILKHIKDGTISSQNVQDLHGMYPALYDRLTKELSQAAISAHDKAELDYPTRFGLSLFMGQPLDSTMAQDSIAMNQPVNGQPQGQTPIQRAPRGSKMALNKLPGLAATPNQARSIQKSNQA